MIERLDAILEKYNSLQATLSSEDVLKDMNQMKALSKELSDLEDVVQVYQHYKQVLASMEEDKEMLHDKELEKSQRKS